MKSVAQLMSLRDRVALVTGGAGHVGAAMADALAEAGASVVLLDLKPDACDRAAARVRSAFGVSALPLAVNLEDEAAVRAAPRAVLDQFGRLDVLVNCAALVSDGSLPGWTTPLAGQRADTWRRALEVNLTAAFVLSQESAPALSESGRGSVINVSSIYGLLGPDLRLYEGTAMGNPAAYAASKGGLLQLTRWMATVLAPKVRVNSITPGGVWRNQPEAFVSRYTERTPLGRMATEEDFKGAALYLASDLSAYVTGQNLVVDGGWTAW